jgi:hypothetical protein
MAWDSGGHGREMSQTIGGGGDAQRSAEGRRRGRGSGGMFCFHWHLSVCAEGKIEVLAQQELGLHYCNTWDSLLVSAGNSSRY